MRTPIVTVVSLVLLWVFAAFDSLQNIDPKVPEAIFSTGEKLYEDGKYKQAADTLKVSARLFGQAKKTVEQVKAANLQAECLSNLGQCDSAGILLRSSLEKISKTANKAVLAETYYYLSRHAGGCARRFDEAIELMRKSMAIKNGIYDAHHKSLAFDYTFLGYIYNSKGNYDSALVYLDRAMQIRAGEVSELETSHTLFNMAASYEGKSQLGKALGLNLQALKIRTNKLGDTHATVSNSINSIGRIYRKLGNNERALEYYRRALEIRKTTLGDNHPNVAASYYEIGNLYGNNSNYHAAIEYIQEGNRILESNSQVANDVLPTYFAYAGKMYGLIGDHDHARALIQKGIAVAEKKLAKDHPYRAIVYNVAGEYYGDAGDIATQSDYFKKAIAIYQSSYGAASEREADAVSKMAATNARLNNNLEAFNLYTRALSMYTARLGEQNPKVAITHLGIGDVQAATMNSSEASRSYKAAFERTDSLNKPLLLRILRSRAKIETPANALVSYRDALEITDEIAQEYNNEASRVQIEKERKELCIAAMETAWDLYNKTPDRSILEEAFSIAEQSRATMLLENTRDRQAKTIAGVPDSLIETERDIRIELAFYRNNLYQSQKQKDTAAQSALAKNIFDTERKLEQFKSQLEKSFPSYYQLKYDKPNVEIATLQKQLPSNTTLLQYFVGGNSIYCFVVSNETFQFKKQAFDQNFQRTFAGYQKSLSDFPFIVSNQKKADSLYQHSARSLYSLLMIPTPMGEAKQRLVVIPDDFLAQLNFGTLLYSDPRDNNYPDFPYLNNQYTLSYAYSTAFLNYQAPESKKKTNKFAGFAPSYDANDYTAIDSAQHPLTALAMRSGYLSLPGAAEEVEWIAETFRGRSWVNEEATETNFKKHGGDFGVLHLAMHSLLNDEEPRYSELLFNRRNDNENDGYLTIAEIYNLKLNAQLVVLSSCSSGFGKIQHGEGPISLSRAFSYAGCPSVVMSLWKVPDLVTTQIMKNFYDGISQGLSKDESLRNAQVKFLRENKDPLYSHPYYWAGFAVIGDTSPIESPTYIAYIISGIFVACIVVMLIYLKRRRDHSIDSSN